MLCSQNVILVLRRLWNCKSFGIQIDLLHRSYCGLDVSLIPHRHGNWIFWHIQSQMSAEHETCGVQMPWWILGFGAMKIWHCLCWCSSDDSWFVPSELTFLRHLISGTSLMEHWLRKKMQGGFSALGEVARHIAILQVVDVGPLHQIHITLKPLKIWTPRFWTP